MEWVHSVGSAGKLSRQSDSLEQLRPATTTYIHTYIHVHTLLQQCMYTVATTTLCYILHTYTITTVYVHCGHYYTLLYTTYIHYYSSVCMYTVATTYRVCMLHTGYVCYIQGMYATCTCTTLVFC